MEFIKTSLPFTFSTVAASLMGAVDTAVVGHLGNYTYINAVSLGAVIFSTVYWLFGFLKISTSGFAAQALGQHDPKLLAGAFIRGVLAAFGIGLLLVILQEPIWRTALLLFNPDAATRPMLLHAHLDYAADARLSDCTGMVRRHAACTYRCTHRTCQQHHQPAAGRTFCHCIAL